MNLDLLTKLVKLANNNPNENEANSAARRACKLIEEGKFEFGVNGSKTTVKQEPISNQQRYRNPYQDPFEWFKQYYKENSQYARQQKEQDEPKQQNSSHRCRNCGAFLGYITVLAGINLCGNCDPKTKEKWTTYDYDFSEPIPKYKPPTETITVKCLFCKQDFKRKSFDINFICHQCYVKKNKSEKPPVIDERTRTYYKSIFCFACGHGFTVTYTDTDAILDGQIKGNCPECKAFYIRATI